MDSRFFCCISNAVGGGQWGFALRSSKGHPMSKLRFCAAVSVSALALAMATPAVADDTVECNEAAGPDGIPGNADDPSNTLECGVGSNVTGDSGVALGSRTFSATEAVAVGLFANASDFAISIGTRSRASGIESTSIGQLAEATGAESVAIGSGAKARDAGSIAIGGNTLGGAGLIGAVAERGGVAIGNSALSQFLGVSIGQDATATGGVAIGTNTRALASDSVAIGRNADATPQGAIAIGANTVIDRGAAIAIGQNAKAQYEGIAFGTGSATESGHCFWCRVIFDFRNCDW